MREVNRRRSVVKAISFRIIATIATFILVYLYVGDLKLSGAIGLLDFVSKLFIYYFHERFWAHIKWGVSKSS